MFENYIILLLVFPTYIYLGMGHEQHQCFSQSDEISIIYPEYSKIQIWNGRTTFIYIFRPFPIPILSAFLSYYIKYMFETLKLSVLFQIANLMWLSNLCLWNKVVETKPSSKWNNDNLLGSTPGTLLRTRKPTQAHSWTLFFVVTLGFLTQRLRAGHNKHNISL